MTLLGTLGSSSCTDNDQTGGANPLSDFALSVSAGACTLTQENAPRKALEIAWSGRADDGSTQYALEISTEMQSLAAAPWSKTFPEGTHAFALTQDELNRIVIDYHKIHSDQPVRLKVKVTMTTSLHWKLYSAADSAYVDCRTYIPVYPRHTHKAPLYWSPYEYNYEKNNYMPEEEWKANIDWVAENLKSYGYTLVSTDGWMTEHALSVCNEYGYITRASAHWNHDYAYWADYCRSKGLQLGIYGNPMWVPREAAEAGLKIKGTNIPIANIVDMNEYRNGHEYNWVQLDREGAEEWVRGYVDHYAEMGAVFLRVDFLSFYQDGKDRFRPEGVGPERPEWMYETALRWMREQCDKHGIFFSVAMNHGYDDAAVERNYAHSIRVSVDTEAGTWTRFSDQERGVHYPMWMQWMNPFDGLIYFSRATGRGHMLLDGDFIRLNTMASADECKSVVSLNVIAGGLVAVADCHDTAGDRLQYYQNRELLALVQDGFVGKPLSDDPADARSQTWTGDTGSGDRIVAVFNRESAPKAYSVSPSELGITGNCTVRDLWEHRSLPQQPTYTGTVPPHGCVVLKISKN